MNSRLSNEYNENLEESQENQKKIGSAEKDPKTTIQNWLDENEDLVNSWLE